MEALLMQGLLFLCLLVQANILFTRVNKMFACMLPATSSNMSNNKNFDPDNTRAAITKSLTG